MWYLLATPGKAEQKKLVEVYQDFPRHVWAPGLKDSFLCARKEKMLLGKLLETKTMPPFHPNTPPISSTSEIAFPTLLCVRETMNLITQDLG